MRGKRKEMLKLQKVGGVARSWAAKKILDFEQKDLNIFSFCMCSTGL